MNNSETKTCQNCHDQFVIESDDFDFYKKFRVAPPTFCPQCRFVRRLVMRNERALYKRKCDLCGADKIMIYDPKGPYKAYCFSCWWSDGWDATSYAREYDFNRSFFEQLDELFRAVPRVGIIQQGRMVNSEYTNRVSDLKNCYLIFASADNENCYYGTSIWNSTDCIDCYNARKCERCYGCLDIFNCNSVRYAKECTSCSDSSFLLNCRGTSDCFGCVNLRNKNYHYFNEPLSREEYREKIKQFDFSDRAAVAAMKTKFAEFSKKFIVPSMVEYHTASSTGNWIEECKNVHDSFNCEKVEDGKYCMGVMEAKDVMDHTYWGKGCELIYSSASIGRQCSSVMFSNESWDQLVRARFCMNCHSSSDLFGCVGLRKKRYCILNKQYAKETYEALVPKIIAHMDAMPYRDSLGREYRYGDFFPADIVAPFAYNETIAQELMTTTREKAEKQGYRWASFEEKNYPVTVRGADLPVKTADVKDSLTEETIGCEHEGKCDHQCPGVFRLTPYELAVYRERKLPLPTLCPNCRHYARLSERLPMKLWKRQCACNEVSPPARLAEAPAKRAEGGAREGGSTYKNTASHSHGANPCPNEFETSYAPERPETVYCLQCYNAEVA